jgi:hypothetical protein
MRTFFISLLIGIAVALGGCVVSSFLAQLVFNHSSHEFGAIYGWAIYLCFVIVTCTRAILSRISKR